MEVVAGGLRGREIRFVRTDGDTYTFGRQGGTDASQIQVENATVSRQHAAMRFVNGRWRIRNLSTTNPLRINGEIADTPRREYTLHDGDRVEMGEVAFLFREH
jgi:pSer/pThr/pTyr-binding forkhead associated (FHA) protein